MGFFSDLKDDLSQAVNELLPDDKFFATLAEGEELEAEEMAEELLEENYGDVVEEELAEEEVVEDLLEEDGFGGIDEMLERVDSIELPAEDLEEVVETTEEVEEVEEVLEEELTIEEEVVAAPVVETVAAPVVNTVFDGEVAKATMMNEERRTDSVSIISETLVINGELVGNCDLELYGTVNGNIDIKGKLNVTGKINGNVTAAEVHAENARIAGDFVCDGTIYVGSSTVIVGNIAATSAVVAGAVKGDIDVQGHVILDNSAIVKGNIMSKSVQINSGAVIEGMCSQCYSEVNPTSFFDDYDEA